MTTFQDNILLFPKLPRPLPNWAMLSIMTLFCATLFVVSRRWSARFSAQAPDLSEFLHPKRSDDPVDLTTLGGTGDMPKDGHPIYRYPRAADVSPELNKIMSGEEIAHEFMMLKIRLDKLEGTKG